MPWPPAQPHGVASRARWQGRGGRIWTLQQDVDWLWYTVYGKEGKHKEEEDRISGKCRLYVEE